MPPNAHCQWEERDGVKVCVVCDRPYLGRAENPIRTCHGKVAPAIAPVKSRGVGDTVAKTIQKATFGLVKPCGGCKQRQAKLNAWFPYATDKATKAITLAITEWQRPEALQRLLAS